MCVCVYVCVCVCVCVCVRACVYTQSGINKLVKKGILKIKRELNTV